MCVSAKLAVFTLAQINSKTGLHILAIMSYTARNASKKR